MFTDFCKTISILTDRHVNILNPGDPFRDWLVEEVVGDRLRNKNCSVNVFKYNSSHTVCKYQFKGEHFSVMAKFFAEPTGQLKDYNPYKGMILDVQQLCVHFPVSSTVIRAVDGVDINIEQSETLAVIGESGSGKSVLGLALLGLLPANCTVNGVIRYHGDAGMYAYLRGDHRVY